MELLNSGPRKRPHPHLLDGYQVYNPKAVVSLMTKGKFRSYWSETGSYEVVIPLICMNFDGLKTDIMAMMAGDKNDPAKIQNRDDVITYLIHLGYLGYNEENGTAFVPNEEIRQELSTAVRNSNWNEMIAFQQESRKLLMATLTKNGWRCGSKRNRKNSQRICFSDSV